MLRRQVTVQSGTSAKQSFVCTVYAHDGPQNSAATDRWYALDDLQRFLRDEVVYDSESSMLNREVEKNTAGLNARKWQELVRQYNTTLQGLSYHVRDLNVKADTLFANAEMIRRETGLLLI
jgi:hypothetical protein